MESLNEQQMIKLKNKQKQLEQKDEERKMKIELYKKNNSKTLNETYALKKDKVNKTLTSFEMKREEKNKKYFDIQRKKEERKQKYDKDLLMKRTLKTESLNKYKSDRLKRALDLEKELNRKRFESYAKKLSIFEQREKNNNISKKEMQKQEQLKQEENLKTINSHKKENEEKLEENKRKYLDKINKIDERYVKYKQNRDKEMKMKYNKMFIWANNVNSDYNRNIAKDSYLRKEKMNQINKRMNRIDHIMLEKQFHNEERQKMEEE